MFISKNWAKSLSLVLLVALLMTAASFYLPLNNGIAPFICNSVYANSENQLTELNEADNQSDHTLHCQHMKFEPDSEDGKVSVIIGFTGEATRGTQRQEKLSQQKNLVENFGGDVERSFTIINAVSARLPLKAVEALSRHREVKYLEQDYKMSIIAQETPWGIDRIFGYEKYTFPTWDHSRGQGMAVAVLDTGIDKDQIDLPTLLGGINTIDDKHWGLDNNGHGTHVAGIIAALDNDTGVVGVAPGAGLYSVKVADDEGQGNYSSLIAGIEWAYNNNIPIINMSLGGSAYSKALEDAIDIAYDGGTLLVAAAGNSGNSTDNVLYPAKYDSVIAVSASDNKDALASFSSRGPAVEFIAPGVSILSLYPDNYAVRFSGTSMASPHVAGSAAVLWGVDHNLNNIEIRTLLQETAQDIGLDVDHQGFGLVRADLAVKKLVELAGNPIEPEQVFTDVSPKMQFHPYIEAIHAEGITTGYSDGTFRPDVFITRGQMAAFLSRALDLPVAGDPDNPTFLDVTSSMHFFGYIEAIYAAGITIGYSDGSFRPNEEVTRGQMAAFLSRALALQDVGDLDYHNFLDVSTNMQFFSYIEAIYAEGIATGYSDGTYRPDALVTRGMMAAFLSRAFNLHD